MYYKFSSEFFSIHSVSKEKVLDCAVDEVKPTKLRTGTLHATEGHEKDKENQFI